MPEDTFRIYPHCCLSAYCSKGSDECPTCDKYPIKKDFDDWAKRTKAVCPDHIWSPTYYEATEG